MGARYLLRFDDVAPNMRWEHWERVEPVLAELDIRPVLGVIPDNRDAGLLAQPTTAGSFWARARGWSARGWTIAMHGYQHRYVTENGGLLRFGAKSEFAGLPQAEQEDKLSKGRVILDTEGVGTDVFMAPGHSFDGATLRALRATGFRRVSDGLALRPYRAHDLLFVPVLSGVVRSAPVGVWTFSIHLNTMDDPGLDRLTRFLRRHRDAFITFDDAERFATRSPINRAAGWALRRASSLVP